MRAPFNDMSLFEYADQVRISHRRDAMRNNQTRTITHHAAKPCQNLLFRVSVNGGKRVIKNENSRRAQDCPRDCRSLFLSARKRDAPFAYESIETFGKAAHILAKPGDLRSPFDIRPFSFIHSESHVLGQGIAEEEGFLRH